jgi:hypothetical protein
MGKRLVGFNWGSNAASTAAEYGRLLIAESELHSALSFNAEDYTRICHPLPEIQCLAAISATTTNNNPTDNAINQYH